MKLRFYHLFLINHRFLGWPLPLIMPELERGLNMLPRGCGLLENKLKLVSSLKAALLRTLEFLAAKKAVFFPPVFSFFTIYSGEVSLTLSAEIFSPSISAERLRLLFLLDSLMFLFFLTIGALVS